MTSSMPGISRRRLFSTGSAMALGATVGVLASTPKVMSQPMGEWPLAPPEREGIDPTALAKVLDDARSLPFLRSLLVVRTGTLIVEQYQGGASTSDLQALNSATKSVASMLVGIALAHGRIPALSSTLGELLPDAAAKTPNPALLAITLEQILTHTSGLAYDFVRQMRDLDTAADPIGFALNLAVDPVRPAPWVYNDAAVSLLSPILVHAWGMSIDDIAKRDLFEPLIRSHGPGVTARRSP